MKNSLYLWLGIIPAMLGPLLGAYVYFVLFQASSEAQFFYLVTKIFTVVWPLFCYLLLFRSEGRVTPFTLGRLRLQILPGMLSGVSIVVLMYLFLLTPLGREVFAARAAITEVTQRMGVLHYYIPFALFLSTLHALIEEYYWRWFVFGGLSRLLPERSAHLLAALSFMAHHVIVISRYFDPGITVLFSLGVAVGGLIWSFMYRKFNALGASWISHMIVDLGIMSVGYMILNS